METASRYLISICLTITIFGLGYFCGTQAEKETRFNRHLHIGTPATSATADTSPASVPVETLRQQQIPRKAGLLV
ncbi:hypothetical protein [Undibacterium sp. Ji49W]|uniref:hypothetical protein n=1 Tax=Undibacterium sp. Ji49W TaxID=3413040 RepID=UPI003BF34B72